MQQSPLLLCIMVFGTFCIPFLEEEADPKYKERSLILCLSSWSG